MQTLEQQLHHALDAHRDARQTGDEEREAYWSDRITGIMWVLDHPDGPRVA